jgi:acetylornithine deacetylase/succinyl-diaminopimelate desuccinylase-like protein
VFAFTRMFFAVLACAVAGIAPAQNLSPQQQLARDIYKELIEINTVTDTGDTLKAAEAMAQRLRAAGFSADDARVLSPAPRKGNLVARLRGAGARKPILLMAHIDVVEAHREDWTYDPFKLTEEGGYFYARGSLDDKFMAAAFVANLIRYKQENFVPERDIIVLLETDEEIGDRRGNGITWLLKNHRDLIDAEYALNEGAGVVLKDGKPLRVGIQTSEKFSVSYRLQVKNPGGHSSVPSKDNAIYRLAEGLSRVSKLDFPVRLNETTRAFFARAAKLESGQLAADMAAVALAQPDPAALARLSERPGYNAQLRTTCVATMLSGGHAGNALPQTAEARVNCRVLPGEPADEVRNTLIRALADPQIAVIATGTARLSQPSPLNPEITGAIERLIPEFFPGAQLIAVMSTGATDGLFLRNAGIPVYGHSGLAVDISENRAHGKDERVLVKSFYQGNEYLYRLVKSLAK